jgi:predicted flap endonuclease-1-like 5' DNA nuclease
MVYLLRALSDWSAAALALGVAFGLFAGAARQRAAWTIWSGLGASLFVAGAVAAYLGIASGRYGFGLETALLLFSFYIVGYGLGALLRWPLGRSKAPAPADPLGSSLEPPPPRFPVAPPPEVPDAAAPAPAPASKPAFADDLSRIHGLDRNAAQELRGLGVRSFAQLAAWNGEQERLFALRRPDFGPAARQFWIAEARLLAGGVEPEVPDIDGGLDEEAALALRKALPRLAAPQIHDSLYPGLRPLSLTQPPQGEGDDLEEIAGIDGATAERLNALGVWTYAQIARWSAQNVRWVGSYLAFPGRIEREGWVGQAQALLD